MKFYGHKYPCQCDTWAGYSGTVSYSSEGVLSGCPHYSVTSRQYMLEAGRVASLLKKTN